MVCNGLIDPAFIMHRCCVAIWCGCRVVFWVEGLVWLARNSLEGLQCMYIQYYEQGVGEIAEEGLF